MCERGRVEVGEEWVSGSVQVYRKNVLCDHTT